MNFDHNCNRIVAVLILLLSVTDFHGGLTLNLNLSQCELPEQP